MSVNTRALSEAPHRRTREQQKRRTRRALLDAALALLDEHTFAELSLRQVTRQAGVVPTAFYRHFGDMDALGVALVEESVGTLRRMIRAARDELPEFEIVIDRSVEILVRHVHAHHAHFRFIAAARSGGSPAVRSAIRAQLSLFVTELATDLGRFPVLDRWSREDRELLAEIMVNQMVAVAESILDGEPEHEQDTMRRASKQLKMIVVGLSGWRSGD